MQGKQGKLGRCQGSELFGSALLRRREMQREWLPRSHVNGRCIHPSVAEIAWSATLKLSQPWPWLGRHSTLHPPLADQHGVARVASLGCIARVGAREI